VEGDPKKRSDANHIPGKEVVGRQIDPEKSGDASARLPQDPLNLLSVSYLGDTTPSTGPSRLLANLDKRPFIELNDIFPQLVKRAMKKAARAAEGNEQDKKAEDKKEKPYLVSTEASDREVDVLRGALPVTAELKQRLVEVLSDIQKHHRETWKKVKELINSEGRNPRDAVLKAAKESRFVGIGEVHTKDLVNPHREFAADIMKDLADQGVTDLAVELPRILQPVFDQPLKDGELTIPDKLMGPDGKEDTSREALGALTLLSRIKARSPELIKMWTEARRAGIEVRCVDNNGPALLLAAPNNPMLPKLMSQRESDIYANMKADLDRTREEGKPPRKMVAWLGDMHVADGRGSAKQKSAVELLKEDLKKKGEIVTTFASELGDSRASEGMSLYPLTEQLDRPVAVPTHDANGRGNVLSPVGFFREPIASHPYTLGAFDQVIIYPKQKVEVVVEFPEFRINPRQKAQAAEAQRADQQVIDSMATRKLDKHVRPDKYLPETKTKEEEERLRPPVDIAMYKREINGGAPPGDVLAEAMAGNRVLGLAYGPYSELGPEADFALRVMRQLKESGATHLAAPFDQEVLDQFNKTGKVDLSKLPGMYVNRFAATYLQAALLNNIQLVASHGTSGFRVTPRESSKAVLDILKDKDARVVLIGLGDVLANVPDRLGNQSVTQLLREANDPSNPNTKVTMATVGVYDAHRYGFDPPRPVTALLGDLKQPVAVHTNRAPHFGRIASGLDAFRPDISLAVWDIVVLRPLAK
jgi:hypothetical protein